MFFLKISTLIPVEGLLQQLASPSIRTSSISIQKPEHHQSELDALSCIEILMSTMPNWFRQSVSVGVALGSALFSFAVSVAWNVCAVLGASLLIGAILV